MLLLLTLLLDTCGDVDKDAIQNVQEIYVSNGTKKLFYLPRTPLQDMKRVIVDSDTLQINEYCYDLENGWIMLAAQPNAGVSVTVETAVSWDVDMGITSWDQSKGNYIFLNSSNPVYAITEQNLPDDFILYQNYPNPFNPSTKIKFTIPSNVKGQLSNVSLKVYDVLGNEVATLVNEYKPTGSYEIEFDARGLTSGIYFYKLQAGAFSETKKMILLR